MRLTVSIEHDVRGLQIPVNNACLMRMVKRVGDSGTQLRRFARTHPLSREPIGQRETLHVVADDVDGIFFAAHFVNTDDIGMLQLSRGPSLAEELVSFRGAEFASPGNLHGDRTIQFDIASPPHGTETATADPVQQFEMPDGLHHRRHSRAVHLGRVIG